MIWDGTSLGTDDTIWGGEFLIGDYQTFSHCGSIRPIFLPWGDATVREIGRIAFSLLWNADLSLKGTSCSPQSQTAFFAILNKRQHIQKLAASGGYSMEFYSSWPVHNMSIMRDRKPLFWKRWLKTIFLVDGIQWSSMKKWTSPIWHASPTPCNCGGHCDSNKSCCDCPRFYGCLAPDGIEQCRVLNPDRLPIVLSGGVFFKKISKKLYNPLQALQSR